jgi:hypothetical protein
LRISGWRSAQATRGGEAANSSAGGRTLLICAAGDIHGAMDHLYRDVLAFEAVLGVRFDCVLHVGDFGIWPDTNRLDKSTRSHDGAGDFPAWFSEKRRVPRPTFFIKGNHEDFMWLDGRQDADVLPGLTYLRNGHTVDIQVRRGGQIRVGGVGGCLGPSDYRRSSDQLQGNAKRHYTSDEIARLVDAGGVDIVLTHDAPAGVRFERHRQGAGTSARRKAWISFWHKFGPAFASLVIITPESMPRFQEFAASDSIRSPCREILWQSKWRQAGGTGHCSADRGQPRVSHLLLLMQKE